MIKPVIVMADLHCFQMSNQATTYTDGVSDRLHDVGYCLRQAAYYARLKGITSLYILGDTFHNKSIMSVTVLNYVYRLLKELRGTFSNITILSGNHDLARNCQDDTAIEVLSEVATIITKPTKLFQDGLNIQFVPYFQEGTISSWKEHVGGYEFDTQAPTVLMGHFGIEGARYSGFEIRAVGERTLEDIQSERYDLVLLGHFHEPQTLSPRAFYVGAPLQHTFADEGSTRGFRVVKVSEGRRGATVEARLVPIEATPKFYTLTKEQYDSSPRGARDFVRLVGVDRATLALLAERDSRICGAKTVETEPTVSKSSVKLGSSTQDILNSYLDYMEVPETHKSRLASVGERFLNVAGVVAQSYLRHSFKFRVACSGYRAFGDTPVEVDFGAGGLTLIRGINTASSGRGSNGSGKTTIFESLVFGLFGKVGKILKDDLVNVTCDSGKVEVVVSRSDGSTMTVHREFARGRKGNSLSVSVECSGNPKHREEFTGTVAEVQTQIEGFLGLSRDTFLLALFCVSSVGEMSPATLSEVFGEILNLEVYNRAHQLVKAEYTEIRNNLATLEIKLAGLEEREKSLVGDIYQLEATKNSVVPTEDTSSDIQEEIVLLKEKITKLTEKKSSLEKLVEGLGKEYRDLGVKVDTLTTKFREAQVILSRKTSEWESAERDKDSKYALWDAGKCPTCASDTQTPDLEEELSDLFKLAREKREEADACSRISTTLQGELYQAKATLAESLSLYNEASSQLNGVVAVLSSHHISLSKLESKLEGLKESQDSYKSHIEGYNKLIYSKEDALLLLEDTISEVRHNRETLEPILSDFDFWITGFSAGGIPNLLIDSALPELNKMAATYSEILTEGEMRVQFTSSTETASGGARNKLGVTVDDLYGYSTYENASSGEKRRIDIILSLALQRFISVRQNLGVILLDEVFVKLDGEGQDALIKLLRYMLHTIPSIFVISNIDAIKNDHFDNVLTVVRRRQKSKLREEV